jgi:PXPV repeat-containing protein
MKKTLTVLAAVGALAVVSVAAPTDANAQWRRGGAVAAGVVTGLAAGAIIGSALAPRYVEPAPVYVAPAPAYVAPGPGACVQPQWVWSARRGEYVWRNVSVPC